MILFKNSFRGSLGDSEYIAVSEALAFCNDNKYPITKPGLIYIGKKEKWIDKYGGHLRVLTVGLIKHLRNSRERIPWGWVSLASMRHLARNDSDFYRLIQKSQLEIRVYGRDKKNYVKEKDIKKYFKEYKQSNNKRAHQDYEYCGPNSYR